MSRILWLSNPPWAPSGYGEQTALFLPRLAKQGHKLAVLCNYGLVGRETRWGDFTCYPSDGHFGNLNLGTFAELHRADQVIVLCDAWVLNPDSWPEGMRTAVWAPVDHWPIPRKVQAVLEHDRVQPVAMCRYALELMEAAGLDPLYVPHAVDTQMFRPQPEIKDAVRDELGVPRDVFLVGMVAANISNPALPRKAFPQAFLAFAELARRHQDAWLYVHSEANPAGTGINLDILADKIGLPRDRVRFPNAKAFQLGIPRQAVAFTYQAFDVLLAPSMGEGFGIPLLEAQACGVPVIASDHSAMTELTEAGWLVDGDPWWDAPHEAFFLCPHVSSIVDALEAAYDARDQQELRDRAVAFAAAYDADTVAETHWRPALAELLDEELEEAVA